MRLVGIPGDVAKRHTPLIRLLEKLTTQEQYELMEVIYHSARTADVTKSYRQDIVLIARGCIYTQYLDSQTKH